MVQKAKMKKRITLQSLIAEEKEIWVLNLTGTTKALPNAGPIVCQLDNLSGDHIQIPPGKDPVCITDQAGAEALKNCRDLFKLIHRNALELLDPADAEKYYQQNKARKEVMESKIDKYMRRAKEAQTDPAKIKVSSTEMQLNPRIPPLCLKAKHKTVEESGMLETLMEQVDAMSHDDFSYLVSNGHFISVREWARENLDRMSDPVEASLAEDE